MRNPDGHQRSGVTRHGHLPLGAGRVLVSLPLRQTSPARQLGWRVLTALLLLGVIVGIVYLDRDAYTDNHDGVVTLVDAVYYATVTITTTGYGDITPIAPHSRALNALVVTPMRIMFLVLLVGTTLEVLATQSGRMLQDARWRKRVRDHVVVVGYGTKGMSTVATLSKNGIDAAQIVIIDVSANAVAEANLGGYAAIEGNGTSRDILRRAEITTARQVIITLDRDDATILAVLTVRQFNPRAHVVAAVREDANSSLMRQSGADAVITTSEAVGRLLGLAAASPNRVAVIEDLLASREGIEFGERVVSSDEVGKAPDEVRGEPVVAVIRDGALRRFYDPAVAELKTGDQVVVVRRADQTG